MATATLTQNSTKSKFQGRAEECAQRILEAFQNPNELPAALAPIFIRRNDPDVPCRKWSYANQLLAAFFGQSDARGYRQWQEVGRHVVKGGKGFPILVPIKRTITKEIDGKQERITIVTGFSSTIVFGVQHTDGEPLPPPDPEVAAWIESLPFLGVAKEWGISVDAYNGQTGKAFGWFSLTGAIALGVRNLSTWAHEMIHAADNRLGNLTDKGQHWRSEIVAELGGAILLTILGHASEADLGGCWKYVNAYAKESGKDTASACISVLNRTCQAVALILDTAETMQGEGE